MLGSLASAGRPKISLEMEANVLNIGIKHCLDPLGFQTRALKNELSAKAGVQVGCASSTTDSQVLQCRIME